jgi:hypothetical protein
MSITINYKSNTINLTTETGAAKLGINTSPDGYLKLPAGTQSIPPLLFTSGTNTSSIINGAIEYDGSNIYFTTGGVRGKFGAGGVDFDAYAPANWWSGTVCSDWGRTQLVLNNSIGAQGGPGQVYQYACGIIVATYAYRGGTLSSNGNIYMIPFSQATQSTWHYINSSGSVVGYQHGITAVDGAYYGAVLAPNGRIYMAPYNQSTQSNWHYIDTSNNTAVAYSGGSGAVSGAYCGGVLTPNGNIYFIPNGQSTQSTWHYINSSGSVVGYSHGVGSQLNSNAYSGGVLAPNGNIYMVPNAQSTQPYWHYINSSGSVVGYQHGVGAQLSSNAYSGGVLGPDGYIYLVPSSQATQPYWHYIDTSNNTVKAYSNSYGSQCMDSAYEGGVLDPKGRIYMIPNCQAQADSKKLHYVDTVSKTIIQYDNIIAASTSSNLINDSFSTTDSYISSSGSDYVTFTSTVVGQIGYVTTTNSYTYQKDFLYKVSGTVTADNKIFPPHQLLFINGNLQYFNSMWYFYVNSVPTDFSIYFKQPIQRPMSFCNTNGDSGETTTWTNLSLTIINPSYSGGILAPNGKIYMIPYGQSSQSNWHYIETMSNKTLPMSACTNPMFNKF